MFEANFDEMIEDEYIEGMRKTRVALTGVTELMRSLKPKKKGHVKGHSFSFNK